ncbi:MAG: M48 family metallopeptidase [Rickettsiales bacterium]|nr:M48 family metallopeptidase [Rickettsiales bacterium]
MKEITLTQENNSTKVNLRKSSRAKNVSIRITPTKQVQLVIPHNVTEEYARKLLIKKQFWIFDKLKTIRDPQEFTTSDVIPIFGVGHRIIHKQSKDAISVKMVDKLIKVCCPADDIKEVILEFLKSFFLEEVTKITKRVAKQMKLSFNKIRITNATTKWGSCSSDKTLSFHWRLVFAPKEIVNYIVVHEVSHLKEMNHSKDFWDLVASIDVDYMFAKKWLKRNTTKLLSILT